MKRKVQAQRKFAQGAYIPPSLNNNNTIHRAETHTQPKEDRNIIHNKISAKNLLDIVSFQGIHTHSKPIVLIERLANTKENESVVPNVAVEVKDNQSAPVTPCKHPRTPKSKSKNSTMCLRSGSRSIDKKTRCLRYRQRYSQIQLDKKKIPKKKRAVVNTEPLSDFDDETPLKYFKSALHEKKAVKSTETKNRQEKKDTVPVKATTPPVDCKEFNKINPLDKQTAIKKNTEINKIPQKQPAENANGKQYYERNRIEGWIDSVQCPATYSPQEAQETITEALSTPLEDRGMTQMMEVINKCILTNSCTSQNVDQKTDVYDFDAERDAQESTPLIYKRKQRNSRASETDEDEHTYLDLLPPDNPHIIQLTSVKIPNQDKTMMRARLIPRTEVNKTQENILLVQHDGLLNRILEDMVPSSSNTPQQNNDEKTTPKKNSNNKTIANNVSVKKAAPKATSKVIKKPGENSNANKQTIVKTKPTVKIPKEILLEKSKPILKKSSNTKVGTASKKKHLKTRSMTNKIILEDDKKNLTQSELSLLDVKVQNGSEDIEFSNMKKKIIFEDDIKNLTQSELSLLDVKVQNGSEDIELSKLSRVKNGDANKVETNKIEANKIEANKIEANKIKANKIEANKVKNKTGVGKCSKEMSGSKARCKTPEKVVPSEMRDCEEVHSKALPLGGADIEGVVKAPTYYLNEDEFSDPIAFFEKVMPIAAKYGLCKVVAPDGFTPKCVINDNMMFKVSNQYIAKLYSRWGPAAKEMCAIKAYLATQNVQFWRAPLLEGIELDLPKLYHLVQRHGGLKQVIEKKRWSKVADEMRISEWTPNPEKALDRLYVKYLLPYDTLSDHERTQIMEEVETCWKNRNRKLVQWALNPLHRTKKLVDDSESSDEEEEQKGHLDVALFEAEDCVVAGRFMNLSRFKKVASNLKESFFGKSETTCSSIEKEYWRVVLEGSDHVSVNSASVDTGNTGLGFTKKNEPGGRHPWNLKMLSQNTGNVLRSLGAVLGVTVPTLHLGMVFSTSCWHRDPHGLPWIEYMHSGPPKIWYGIPDEQSAKFRKAVESLCPTWCQNKSVWLPSDVTMIPPALLKQHGVSLSRITQNPGEFIIVFPKAYSCSISTGYTVSESVYFATDSWLMGVQDVFAELAASCEPTTFSLEQLAVALARDDSLSGRVLRLAGDLLRAIRNQELPRRIQWRQRKLDCYQVQRKKKHTTSAAWNVREQDECEVCRATLYLSKVMGVPSKKSSLCLEHALHILNMPKHKDIDLTSASLVIYYPDEELETIVNDLQDKI